MGLCKCPKRKVTNLFCFEHRVNVCEHCLVKKHPKCVVQSYLAWLQDSDYDPNCPLCGQDLTNGDQCVRLVCYHVFHWSCLDRQMRSLPLETTAPAGYACPVCQECVFPPDKLVSPVADELRSVLKGVNWARAGLGMPLLPQTPRISEDFFASEDSSTNTAAAAIPSGPRPQPEGQSSLTDRDFVTDIDTPPPATTRKQLQSALPTSPLLLAAAAAAGNEEVEEDHDDHKYRRRSALRFLVRWWRTVTSGGRGFKRMSKGQRYLTWAAAAIFGFVTVLVIFSHLSGGARSDPMLDPMNNPNIKVDSSM